MSQGQETMPTLSAWNRLDRLLELARGLPVPQHWQIESSHRVRRECGAAGWGNAEGRRSRPNIVAYRQDVFLPSLASWTKPLYDGPILIQKAKSRYASAPNLAIFLLVPALESWSPMMNAASIQRRHQTGLGQGGFHPSL